LQLPIIGVSIQEASAGTEFEEIEVIGILDTIWGDPEKGDTPTVPAYFITNSDESFNLVGVEEITAESGGPQQFNRQEVFVFGLLDIETDTIQVLSIEKIFEPPASHILGPHTLGSQQWVTILCRFADSTGVTPQPLSYYETEIDRMEDYWEETSYNNIDLAGSVERDWANLPQNRIDYLDQPPTHFVGHTLNWAEIAVDCTGVHDAAVNFPNFDGINLIFNQPLDCCAWGGSLTLNLDGATKTYDMTWLPPFGWGNLDVLGQEMGHAFGLPHSSGPYASTYDSQWDVMSSGGTCAVPDTNYGCLPVHTVSVHKDALGWIDPSERYVATTAPNQVIFIQRLALPTAAGFLTAQIPIGGSATDFYTLETRKLAGFDALGAIPGEAVVIHKVDTTLGDRNAKVVDVDAVPNTNPNDAGAQWVVGEVFEDVANNISVEILEMTADSFKVVINPTVVGGEFLPINNTALILAGAQSFSWMIPVVLSVLGIGLFVVSRKSE